jgi:hypothetical protein
LNSVLETKNNSLKESEEFSYSFFKDKCPNENTYCFLYNTWINDSGIAEVIQHFGLSKKAEEKGIGLLQPYLGSHLE